MVRWLIYSSIALNSMCVFLDKTDAHDAPLGWAYGQECCSVNDCYQESEDNIEIHEDGYHIVTTGEVIKYSDTRIKKSQDQYFHRCTRFGDRKQTSSICLYVPNRGF